MSFTADELTEVSIALARQILRAQEAEAKVIGLEQKIKELEKPSGSDK